MKESAVKIHNDIRPLKDLFRSFADLRNDLFIEYMDSHSSAGLLAVRPVQLKEGPKTLQDKNGRFPCSAHELRKGKGNLSI
jgi:hypothetical protein